ncbi:hypothetical protein [Desulfovulcanus sp.]
MDEQKLNYTLGRIEAKLEHLDERLDGQSNMLKEINDRLRKVEIKSVVLGSVSAGLTVVAAKLKTHLGL